ncbi:MAG: cytidylate kinase family protein [Anaerolineae bacterium]
MTVSREMASHGCEIAAEVARIVDFRFIDREIIHRAAEEAGVPRIALQVIAYEGRRNVLDRTRRR